MRDNMWEHKFLTHLTFFPSSSTLAAGSNIFSCRSLRHKFSQNFQHLKFNPDSPVPLFSSKVFPILLQPGACILAPPIFPNVTEDTSVSFIPIIRPYHRLYHRSVSSVCTIRLYLRKIPGTFSIASSISSGVITLWTQSYKILLQPQNTSSL